MEFIYRLHAIQRMFERDISEEEVEVCVLEGEIIESYLDDKPYPSYLCLNSVNGKIIHVVYAKSEDTSIVITVYEPDPAIWENDFKRRKEK